MARKIVLILLLCSAVAWAADKPCVIVSRHKKTAGEALVRWTEAKPFDYVEGNFPSSVKFKAEVSEKMIRQIQGSGGKVVILPEDYHVPDLQDARNTCKAFQKD